MEKMKINFEIETAISEQLINQITERLYLMELAVIEIQSALCIQTAYRKCSSRKCLYKLKMIKYLSLWFYNSLTIKKRKNAKNKISLFFYSYIKRIRKIKLYTKLRSVYIICQKVYNWYIYKKYISFRSIKIISKSSVKTIFFEGVVMVSGMIVVENKRLKNARMCLSELLWALYARFKRIKM